MAICTVCQSLLPHLSGITQFHLTNSGVDIPRADDIVVMRLPRGYTHLGVMVDDHNMLHVLKDRPSSISPLRRFRSRIVAVYRLERKHSGTSFFSFLKSLKKREPAFPDFSDTEKEPDCT